MQTRLSSFYEALINVVIGWSINFTANAIVLPLIGFDITVSQNLLIGTIFTVISLVRQYIIRRWFNKRITNAAIAAAARTFKATGRTREGAEAGRGGGT